MGRFKIIIKKTFKWLSILLITFFIILWISIYVSSLNSYKESDFNIPKDFFNTKFWDKDPYSNENWFQDYILFTELLNDNTELLYFDFFSRCYFDEGYNNSNCNDEMDEDRFNKFKNLIAVNKIKYKKINNKNYILETPEYSWAYIWEKAYWTWENIIYIWLIQYSRAIRFVAYKYFEEWKYEQWINVLLEFQLFIDSLMNKTDSNLINFLVYFTVNKINIEALNYFIDNYELNNKINEDIKIVLNKQIDEWLVENSLKREHLSSRTIFQYLWDDAMNKDEYENYFRYYYGMIETFLFFSVKETELISDKLRFDLINNKWLASIWICENNISNYLWRNIVCNNSSIYSNQYQKEENMRKLRSDTLEKLK